MKALLVAIGTMGDILPFVALGKALIARGHSACLLASGYFEPIARDAGLDFVPLSTKERYLEFVRQQHLGSGLESLQLMVDELLELTPTVFDALRDRFEPDETVVIAQGYAFGARVLQDKVGVKTATVHLQPIWMRSQFRGPGVLRKLPSVVSRGLNKLFDGMIDRRLSPRLNQFRREQGLGAIEGVMHQWWNSPDLVLGLFPDWFEPPQRDWPAGTTLTGFPLSLGGSFRPEVDAFLNEGSPPLVFSQSSLIQDKRYLEICWETARSMNERAVVLSASPELIPETVPPGCACFPFTPFEQILPRAKAHVHHAEIGAIAETLAAGIPQLTVPMGYDQNDNALRLAPLGVSRRLVRDKFTAARAAARLNDLLSDSAVAARCQEYREKARAQDALAIASEAIERLAERGKGMAFAPSARTSDHRRRFVLVSLGSMGDTLPFLSIGKVAKARGHDVVMVANEHFQSLIENAGFRFVPSLSADDYSQFIERQSEWSDLEALQGMGELLRHQISHLYHVTRDLYLPGRTVVASQGYAYGTRIAREKHGIPLATTHLQPMWLRSIHDSPTRPRWFPDWAARGVDRLIDVVLDGGIGRAVNDFRQSLGLSRAVRFMKFWWNSPDLILGLFPSWFNPPQPDWPQHVELVGFPILSEDNPGDTTEVERFLSQGTPPLVFIQSSVMRDAGDYFNVSIESATKLGRRAILLTPHAEQIPPSLPSHVAYFRHVPLEWLLPRSSGFVHHGGIGTIAHALAAAVPQLVVPMIYDQPDNSLRLKKLGVAEFLWPKQYKVGRVTAALRQLLDQPEVAERCQRFARLHQEDHGLERACDLLERLVGSENAPIDSLPAQSSTASV